VYLSFWDDATQADIYQVGIQFLRGQRKKYTRIETPLRRGVHGSSTLSLSFVQEQRYFVHLILIVIGRITFYTICTFDINLTKNLEVRVDEFMNLIKRVRLSFFFFFAKMLEWEALWGAAQEKLCGKNRMYSFKTDQVIA
jgi:hypothetical protein